MFPREISDRLAKVKISSMMWIWLISKIDDLNKNRKIYNTKEYSFLSKTQIGQGNLYI